MCLGLGLGFIFNRKAKPTRKLRWPISRGQRVVFKLGVGQYVLPLQKKPARKETVALLIKE